MPVGVAGFTTTLSPETRGPADDGRPRWHHLCVRYAQELNRHLAGD